MPGFVLQVAPAPAEIDRPAVRVGFTVSRKVGNAVERNRVRRRLREVARLVIPAQARPDLDYVLLMSVDPGFGGQRFIPTVMTKIASLKRHIDDSGARARIEVDGGIGTDNIVAIREHGADILVAGSAVFDGHDPKGRARALADLLKSARRG